MHKTRRIIFIMQRSKFILRKEVKTIFISAKDYSQPADKFDGSMVTNGRERNNTLWDLAFSKHLLDELLCSS